MNHKIGATSKSVNELYRTTLPEFSPLPCVRDALPKLAGVLRRNRWPFKWLVLVLQDDDWRLPDMQPQLVRSIGMEEMKEIVHRNRQHAVMETNLRISIKDYSGPKLPGRVPAHRA